MKKSGIAILLGLWLLAAAVYGFEQSTQTSEEFPKIKPTGYLRIRYTQDQTPGRPDGFNLAAARFGFTGDISKYFSFTFTVEGTNTDNENRKLVYDAFIETTLIRNFRIRLGQFKYGFGLEQTTPDADNDWINKADVVTNLIKPTRDIGIQVSRDLAFGGFRSSFFLALINGSGSNADDENDRKTLLGRLVLNPLPGLFIGSSYYDGTTGVSDKKTRAGLELKWEWRRLMLKAEYIAGQDKAVKKEGYYLTLGYTVLPRTVLLLRYDTWNPDKSLADKDTARWTFGVNYFFSKTILLRTNYEYKIETPGVRNDVIMTQLQIKL